MTMISDEAALVGKNLDNVFAHFRDRAAADGALVDLESTKFRKKDLPLSQGIKSTLKHRIQTATGRQFKDIEEELGYSQVGNVYILLWYVICTCTYLTIYQAF